MKNNADRARLNPHNLFLAAVLATACTPNTNDKTRFPEVKEVGAKEMEGGAVWVETKGAEVKEVDAGKSCEPQVPNKVGTHGDRDGDGY